jgi:hypothetical protein
MDTLSDGETTPSDVLAARSPQDAAHALARYLKTSFDADELVVWSPEEAAQRGFGDAWAVCWESGPFEWTVISEGLSLRASELGHTDAAGPFPDGIQGEGWYAEPYNNFILSFYAK